jgi:hypothetical protein
MTLLKNEVAAFGSLLQKAEKDKSLFATHISLLAALFVFWQRNSFKSPFNVNRKELMAFSKIASIATYHKCMRELDSRGYIKYARSFHPKTGSQPCLLAFTIYLNPDYLSLCDIQQLLTKMSPGTFSPRTISQATSIAPKSFREIERSKRKLGGALLCLPYATLRGFCVSSGDTLHGFSRRNKKKKDTWQYPV